MKSILLKILFVELHMPHEGEVMEMVDTRQALKKRMKRFVATVEHIMNNIEKHRTCAKQVEQR